MPQAELEVYPQDHDSLLLKLSGNWTLAAGIPDTGDLEKQMQSGSIKRITFRRNIFVTAFIKPAPLYRRQGFIVDPVAYSVQTRQLQYKRLDL